MVQSNLYTFNFKRMLDSCCAQTHTCTRTVHTQHALTYYCVMATGPVPGNSSVEQRLYYFLYYLHRSVAFSPCSQPRWVTALPGLRAVAFDHLHKVNVTFWSMIWHRTRTNNCHVWHCYKKVAINSFMFLNKIPPVVLYNFIEILVYKFTAEHQKIFLNCLNHR